jgi:hypothetical protein
MAALGAVATVLVAGSQLTALHNLKTWSAHFWVALCGLLLALLSVITALWAASRVLTPVRFGFGPLAAASELPVRRVVISKSAYDRFKYALVPIAHQIDAQPLLLLGRQSLASLDAEQQSAIKNLWALDNEPDRYFGHPATATEVNRARYALENSFNSAVRLARQLTELAQFEVIRRRFQTALRVLWLAALVGAIGIGLFAWAGANSSGADSSTSTTTSTTNTTLRQSAPPQNQPSAFGNSTAEALDHLAQRVTSPAALNLINQVLGRNLEQATPAVVSHVADRLIQQVGDDVVQPLMSKGLDRLFNTRGAPRTLPADWSQILQADIQARLASTVDPATAALLAGLLERAIDLHLAPLLPATSVSGTSGGTTIIILNQSDGHSTTITLPHTN